MARVKLKGKKEKKATANNNMTTKWIDMKIKKEENIKLAKVAACMDNWLRETNVKQELIIINQREEMKIYDKELHKASNHLQRMQNSLQIERDLTTRLEIELISLRRRLYQYERRNSNEENSITTVEDLWAYERIEDFQNELEHNGQPDPDDWELRERERNNEW